MSRKAIYEVRVRRENNDPDTVFLCRKCIGTTGDFLRVTSKKKCSNDGTCDRCG